MSKSITCLMLVCCLGLAAARYMAVPVEDVMDLGELTRLRTPREVESVGPIRGVRGAKEEDTSNEREGYVDFGAHTGSRGAYGWYADFPARI